MTAIGREILRSRSRMTHGYRIGVRQDGGELIPDQVRDDEADGEIRLADVNAERVMSALTG